VVRTNGTQAPRRGSRQLSALAAVLAALAAAATATAHVAHATVAVYPAGTSFTASGAAPSHAGSSVSLAMPIGGVDDAEILVRGARHVSAPTTSLDAPLQLRLLFAHYVSVNGRPVPDALEPWDGRVRRTEETNQPIWVQVTVPQGTAPGTYTGSIRLVADGTATVIPIAVDVADVTLPPPGQVAGSLLTAFNVSPQSYGAEVHRLFRVPARRTPRELFGFLGSYRISPNNWGFANPATKRGYGRARAARMSEAIGNPRQFSSMWIPISNNRSTPHEWAARVSPYQPRAWCRYLRAVKGVWGSRGWLPGAYPYLWGLDEPGAALYPVLRQQATTTHRCWPGSHVVVTGKPTADNRFLWNGGRDDVDVWAVLESRYYGEFTTPGQRQRGENRGTMFLRYINAARKRGKQIWTYTYSSNSHDTPGLAANEPVADARMFVEWAALEGITGLLRGEGMTSYTRSVNPFVRNDRENGDYVLIYPGRSGPVASARLEELREGIEDWEILNIVRQQHGSRAVVKLLSGLFSTTANGAKLACVVGCPIKSSRPYSWPLWSKSGATATLIAEMRAKALAAAAP
jgi:hypothetical protein